MTEALSLDTQHASGALAERPTPPVWIVAALADVCAAEDRAAFAERAADGAVGTADRLLLVTCHRAELLGAGELPAAPELAGLAGAGHLAARLRLFRGEAAVRHAFRLAAGLESAVVGEDQVLHQVRQLRDEARRAVPLEPHLARLLELALGVGRRARAARLVTPGGRAGRTAAPGGDESLARRALGWLAERGAACAGTDLLVVGAGEMGRLLAGEARSLGARVTVASRHRDRAEAAARAVGGTAVDLVEATAVAPRVSGVAIALRGRWAEAERLSLLPPTVDLSSPPALGPGRAVEHLDIDGLYGLSNSTSTELAARQYAQAAEPLVEDAVSRYARWSAGRASVGALRDLREAADRSRGEELVRLLRRLPDLDERERHLVEAFSQQLVAAILHEPTVRLREDPDGAVAAAARSLFGL